MEDLRSISSLGKAFDGIRIPTVWIEFIWIIPNLRVVVDVVDCADHNSSFLHLVPSW